MLGCYNNTTTHAHEAIVFFHSFVVIFLCILLYMTQKALSASQSAQFSCLPSARFSADTLFHKSFFVEKLDICRF